MSEQENQAEFLEGKVKVGSIEVPLATEANQQSAYVSMQMGPESVVYLLKSDNDVAEMQQIGQQVANCDSYHSLFSNLSQLDH